MKFYNDTRRNAACALAAAVYCDFQDNLADDVAISIVEALIHTHDLFDGVKPTTLRKLAFFGASRATIHESQEIFCYMREVPKDLRFQGLLGDFFAKYCLPALRHIGVVRMVQSWPGHQLRSPLLDLCKRVKGSEERDAGNLALYFEVLDEESMLAAYQTSQRADPEYVVFALSEGAPMPNGEALARVRETFDVNPTQVEASEVRVARCVCALEVRSSGPHGITTWMAVVVIVCNLLSSCKTPDERAQAFRSLASLSIKIDDGDFYEVCQFMERHLREFFRRVLEDVQEEKSASRKNLVDISSMPSSFVNYGGPATLCGSDAQISSQDTGAFACYRLAPVEEQSGTYQLEGAVIIRSNTSRTSSAKPYGRVVLEKKFTKTRRCLDMAKIKEVGQLLLLEAENKERTWTYEKITEMLKQRGGSDTRENPLHYFQWRHFYECDNADDVWKRLGAGASDGEEFYGYKLPNEKKFDRPFVSPPSARGMPSFHPRVLQKDQNIPWLREDTSQHLDAAWLVACANAENCREAVALFEPNSEKRVRVHVNDAAIRDALIVMFDRNFQPIKWRVGHYNVQAHDWKGYDFVKIPRDFASGVSCFPDAPWLRGAQKPEVLFPDNFSKRMSEGELWTSPKRGVVYWGEKGKGVALAWFRKSVPQEEVESNADLGIFLEGPDANVGDLNVTFYDDDGKPTCCNFQSCFGDPPAVRDARFSYKFLRARDGKKEFFTREKLASEKHFFSLDEHRLNFCFGFTAEIRRALVERPGCFSLDLNFS